LSGSTTAAGGGLASFFDFDALVAQLAANLTAPIFQGGRLRANVEVQEAVLEQQLQTYIGTVLDAYLDVENALDGEARLAERETALRIAVDESLEAEERLELRYTEGLATILQLLDAQSRRLSAEGQLISARAERLQNRVRLHVALGGGAYGDIPPDALPAFLRDQG
jgi:outer membrane protein TolC